MLRFGILLSTLFAIAGASQAHFIFIVPDVKNPEKAIIVFSDDLNADDGVDIGKIAGMKFQARDAAGKDSAVAAAKLKDSLDVTAGKDARLVFWVDGLRRDAEGGR